jgi:hypothetical protein
MTDIYENAPIYVCAGCEREMEDPKNAYLKSMAHLRPAPIV